MSITPTSVPTKILGSSITSSATSFILTDILGWDNNPLTAADFGTQGYCVFRNAARTQIEIMEWNPATIASGSITIIRRGLKFTGDLTTEVTANKLSWTKGDTYVDLGTDTPQLLAFYLGDVVGPASSTDNAVARFDTATGVLLQNSVVLISDTGVVSNANLTESTNIREEITTVASSATPTPTGGSLCNFFTVTALVENATFAAPTGTPVNGNQIIMRVTPDATPRTLAYNAIYRAVGVSLPAITVASKTMYFGMKYNSLATKWDIIAYGIET
jgi:hypothetical protein